MQRTPHVWKVRVQSGSTGQETVREIRAHWDPEHELTQESVMTAGACDAYMRSGPVHERRDTFAPLSCELVS